MSPPPLARADLEHLLQARKLATTLPPGVAGPVERRIASTGLETLDHALAGGWPRGHVSEVVGPLSAGGSWIACASLAAATRRGELAALIDPLDRFDPESASSARIVWPHLLRVRGDGAPQRSGMPAIRLARDIRTRSASAAMWLPVIERAIKALALVLQAEGFGLVVLDLQGVPSAAVRHLPFTTWRRVQRLIEGRDTACLVVHSDPLARSSAGISLVLDTATAGVRGQWRGQSAGSSRFTGVSARARVIRAQWEAATLDGFVWESETRSHQPSAVSNQPDREDGALAIGL